MSISMPGMGTGLDIQGLATAMAQADLAPKSNQLAKRENNINGEIAALEQLESALNTFFDSMDRLTDPQNFGTLTVNMPGDSSDFFGVKVDENAKPNSYQVEVDSLATRSKWLAMSAESSDTVMPEGEMVIEMANPEDNFTIKIEEGDTLEDVMNKINDHEENPGIDATIVSGSNGAQLTVTSRESGTESAIKGIQRNSPTNDLEIPRELTAATDAVIYIDGLEVVSQSNTIEDAIPGVTFDLKKVSDGEVFTIDLSTDTDQMKSSINSVVDSYNDLMKTINDLTKREPAKPGETAVRPPLASDSMVSSLQSQLRSALSEPVSGSSYGTLASIGIITTRTGELEVDSKLLDKALEENPDEVVDMFIGPDGAVNGLMDVVEAYTGKTSSSGDDDDDDEDDSKSSDSNSDGLIGERLDRLRDDLSDIDSEWAAINERGESLYNRYFNQFVAMDLAVQQMNSTLSMLYMM